MQPITEYASCVWGAAEDHNDVVQNRALRYFLGVHKFTPVSALIGDMAWLQR